MRLFIKLSCGILIFFYRDSVAINKPYPLKILFVVNYFPAPSQTFILNIITGLIDRGHDVSIFSFHKGDCAGINLLVEKYSLLDRVIYEQLPIILPEYDIIFCQFGYVGKYIFEMKKLKKWLKNKKVVVCFRGSDLTAHIKDDPKMYKELFKKGTLFLPVCDYFKKRLVELGCHSHKIVVHFSAINCVQFAFKKRKKPEAGLINLVSVCRLVEKKGIDIALSAVAKVLRKYSNIHFTIIGDGPERLYLEKLIQKLKISGNVTMYGWATREQVVTILNNSHIFLLPSLTSSNGDEEGIANALKEAMAMGLLSISTWHAGTPELIEDGISGFLVPEGDSMQLAKKIEYSIDHPEIWRRIQKAARKKIEEKFEIKQSIEQLEKIFYSL